jgi:predicted PurR-regulated permease PerM
VRSEFRAWIPRGAGFTIGVAAVLAVAGLAIAAAPVLVLIFVAILLGSALEPIVGWLRGHLPLGRGATILLVYAGFFVLVLALALVIVPAALHQGGEIIKGLPASFDRAREWVATVRPATLAASLTAVIDEAETLSTPPAPDPDVVVRAGMTVAESFFGIMTLLTIVFFWLVEHARLQRYLLAFLPAARRAGARDAWNEIESRLGRWVQGSLILMGTMGLATAVAYSVLGVPSPLLLALVAALAQAIPIVGPLLGAIPAVLVAATVSPQLALAVAVVCAIVQFVEGNVLVPLVMRNTIGLSPFVVLATVLVGGAAGGFVGALLALPLAASAMVVLERLQAREVPVAQDPAADVTPDLPAARQSLPDAAHRGAD